MLLNFQYVVSYHLVFIQQVYFNKYLLSAFCVLGTIRSPGNVSEQNRQDHCSHGVDIPVGGH